MTAMPYDSIESAQEGICEMLAGEVEDVRVNLRMVPRLLVSDQDVTTAVLRQSEQSDPPRP